MTAHDRSKLLRTRENLRSEPHWEWYEPAAATIYLVFDRSNGGSLYVLIFGTVLVQ
jgi:hypothetical protein